MTEILKRGSRGDGVKLIQRTLHLYEDGIFGPLTEEAVKEFQKSHGLEADGVVGAKTWAALADLIGLKKSKRSINEIIVHCTASVEGKHFSVADIRRWHKQRGWSDIGYHYVVYLNGSVHVGRDVNISGAHTLNHNSHSIGVVYVGGLASDRKTAKDTRTNAQKKSLRELLVKLKGLYPNATIHGHYEFANKACPCFKPKEEYSDI